LKYFSVASVFDMVKVACSDSAFGRPLGTKRRTTAAMQQWTRGELLELHRLIDLYGADSESIHESGKWNPGRTLQSVKTMCEKLRKNSGKIQKDISLNYLRAKEDWDEAQATIRALDAENRALRAELGEIRDRFKKRSSCLKQKRDQLSTAKRACLLSLLPLNTANSITHIVSNYGIPIRHLHMDGCNITSATIVCETVNELKTSK
jgi:hypothetical protein